MTNNRTTAIEQTLTGIWATLLSRSPIGRDDHFFELGGHSVLAIQLASRITETFGVDVSLADVFASPTIAGLADLIAACDGEPAPPSGR